MTILWLLGGIFIGILAHAGYTRLVKDVSEYSKDFTNTVNYKRFKLFSVVTLKYGFFYVTSIMLHRHYIALDIHSADYQFNTVVDSIKDIDKTN